MTDWRKMVDCFPFDDARMSADNQPNLEGTIRMSFQEGALRKLNNTGTQLCF